MDFLAAGINSLISLFVLGIFVAGVMKLFQIHSVLTEIKDGLRTADPVSERVAAPYTASSFGPPVVRSVTTPTAPTELHAMGSGDDMLRALDAQMKWDENASRSETR